MIETLLIAVSVLALVGGAYALGRRSAGQKYKEELQTYRAGSFVLKVKKTLYEKLQEGEAKNQLLRLAKAVLAWSYAGELFGHNEEAAQVCREAAETLENLLQYVSLVHLTLGLKHLLTPEEMRELKKNVELEVFSQMDFDSKDLN